MKSKKLDQIISIDLNSLCLTASQACAFYEVTRRTLRNWVKRGFPQKGRGKYPLLGGFRWYKSEVLGEVGEETSLAREKLLRERARRERDEILLKQLKGELVRRGEALSWVLGLVNEARILFLGLPKRLAPLLQGKGLKEMELAMRIEINDVLNAMARERRSSAKRK